MYYASVLFIVRNGEQEMKTEQKYIKKQANNSNIFSGISTKTNFTHFETFCSLTAPNFQII